MTPGLPPPAIAQPAAYEASYGLVTGTVAGQARRIVVRLPGGRILAAVPMRGRHFTLHVSLPARETAVAVTVSDARGRRATRTVRHVLGLPRAAAPALGSAHEDRRLAADVRRLATAFPGTAGVYVQDLKTGAGAAWNARATFPGASALKLAIAVAALAHERSTPVPGSTLDRLLRQMLIVSDNGAANTVERYVAGSTLSGAAFVTETMRSIGLADTVMYGGYVLGTGLDLARALAASIPVRTDDQPSFGVGKRTTAWDLARLARAVWLASGGLGPLRAAQPGFTARDARYLLYLLALVHDSGKLDRELAGVRGVVVAHKAGWVQSARHDNGLVFWPGGVYVVTVMTFRPAGAGLSSDVLAGRVARVALAHFDG